MLRLKSGQRILLRDKLADAANVAIAALFFGQFLSEQPFSVVLAVIGLSSWAIMMAGALYFATEEREP